MAHALAWRRHTIGPLVLALGFGGLGLLLATPAVGVSAHGDETEMRAVARADARADVLYLKHEPWAVSALSATDAWEVGRKETTRQSGFARHWDGTAWTHVRTAKEPEAEFQGVKALAPDDVWAVGSWDNPDGSGFGDPIVEHWDGARWRVVPCFDPGGFSTLNAIDGLSSHDLWAVGVNSTTVGPLIEHWNGSAWSVLPVHLPSGEGNFGFLFGVKELAPNDVWAVGAAQLDDRQEPLIEHWNGTTWSRQRIAMPQMSVLLSVDAASPTDVWASGYVGYQSGQPGEDHARVVHYDGSHWSTSLALDGTRNTFLSGIAEVSSTDVWAVGNRSTPTDTQPMPMQWNGQRWTRVDAPTVGTVGDSFTAVTALSPDLLIAAGTYDVLRGVDVYERSLSEEWNGTAWTVMP